VDNAGNVSWNLLAPEDLIDDGDPSGGTAFDGIWEACAAPCKSWFQSYSCCNLPSSDCSCTATSITPYIQVNDGTWQQTSGVTVSSGDKVVLGPQPTSGGSWSWSGCNTSGTTREQTFYPTSTCTATATYTNSCGTTSTQSFTITVSGSSSSGLVNNGIYTIEFQTNSNKVLDLQYGTDANGTVLRPYDKNGATAQQWIAVSTSDGYWRFKSNASSTGRAIDLANGATTNGTSIRLWENYSNDAQAWQVTSVGNDYYKIVSKLNTGKSWDVSYCNMDGTQNLQLWDYYGTSCQLFKFNYVGTKSANVSEAAQAAATSDFEVYPNPSASGNFTISVPDLNAENCQLMIYNPEGKKVFEQNNLTAGDNQVSPGLAKGIYFIKVSSNNKSTGIKKLVVQ
jgi:endoglucanase